MLEFADFQRKALSFADKLKRRCVPSFGCCSFFYSNSNNLAIHDSYLIQLVANSLDVTNDKMLSLYLEYLNSNVRVTESEISKFKTKVLNGIYIFVWSGYKSTLPSYFNDPIIELLQKDLGVSSLDEMDPEEFDASLYALSRYCSFAYHNQKVGIYSDLIKHMGQGIQVEIETLRNRKSQTQSFLYEMYLGVKSNLGFNFSF